MALGGLDGTVALHCCETAQLLGQVTLHRDPVLCLTADAQSALFSGSSDRRVGRCTIELTGSPLSDSSERSACAASFSGQSPLLGHTSEVLALCHLPEHKKLFSASADREVLMWNFALKDPQCTHRFQAHECSVHLVQFVSGWLVSGSTDGTMASWPIPCVCPHCGEGGLNAHGLDDHWDICPSRPRLCL